MAAISQWMVTFLLNSLWQTALIFAVAQIGSWTLRQAPGRFRYRIWFSASILALLLPLASGVAPFRLSSIVSFTPVSSLEHTFRARTHDAFLYPTSGFAPLWMYVLLACYLAFLAYRVSRFVSGWRWAKQLCRSAQSTELSAPVRSILERCRCALDVKAVPIGYSALVRGPVTVGILKPIILFPKTFWLSATTVMESEWLSMLSHEMAHVRRKDFAKNLACELLFLPISFHPLVAVMKSRLAAAREIACDELATERCINSDDYARSLLSLAKKMYAFPIRSSLDYSLGILDANILEERIMKLLHRQSLSLFWARTFLVLALVSLAGLCIPASAVAFRTGQQAEDESNILQVGPGITAPRPIFTPDPEYPRAARDAHQQGMVRVMCIIGTDGLVRNARVVRSLGPEFDENSIEALRRWKFEPGLKDGKPIDVKISIEIEFSL